MSFEKHINREILNLAREILKAEPEICDHCLGRQFAQVGHGFSNAERGSAVRKTLKAKPSKKCAICGNFFQSLDSLAKEIAKKLKEYEFDSFLVGTTVGSEMIEKEESLWERVGIEYCEPIKAEINRELGKRLEKLTGKKASHTNPDITIVINTEKGDFTLEVAPLFIYGKYRKLVRGIPQTKWDMYPETVEDIVAEPFMKETKGKNHSFHGMGREDIDARCLGWRPFVLEISKPRKRHIDLEKMRREVNSSGKVELSGLRFSDRREVARLKAARPDKTYRVLVEFEKPITEDDIKRIESLSGIIVEQETPERVLHRRPDITRKRKIKKITARKTGERTAELEITGEAGLYIKELVTGDRGRTRPSISDTLHNYGEVLELDVIKIHTGREWD